MDSSHSPVSMIDQAGVMVAGEVLLWGAVAGAVHFVFLGVAYGNPLVDGCTLPPDGIRRWSWPSRSRYLAVQLWVRRLEVYLLTLGFVRLRPLVDVPGLVGTVLLGGLFAVLRVYPRFWNMWIQGTYPRRRLAVEVVNGVLGTLVVVAVLHFAVAG